MSAALVVARFTIQEAVRRRLILAGVLLSLLFVGLFTLGFSFAYDRALEAAAQPRNRTVVGLVASMLTVLGLYAVYFLSGFLALFLSVGAVSGEVDAGTLHAVLARPLRRGELILGRWLAFLGLVSAYVAAMAGLLLLVARLIAGYEAPDPLRAIALMALGAVLLLSLSLFGSTLMPTLANGVVMFTLFGLAWMAGVIEALGTVLQNPSMVTLGVVVSLLVPSDELWRSASYYLQSPAAQTALAAGRDVVPFLSSDPPALAFVLWSLAYPLVFLGAAVLAFSRRDL